MDLRRFEFGGASFSPEDLALMSSAFDMAWETIVKSGARLSEAETETTRERLAKRIIEVTRRGERDVFKLVNDALEHVTRLTTDPKPLIPD
jgi:hypothetical protein